MRTGKLSSEELKNNVLDVIRHRRSEVVCGAFLGEDCASFSCDGLMLISTDPITAEVSDIGRLAIQVSVNDIVAGGGEPVLCMLTIIAPPTATAEDIKKVMVDAETEADKHNIEIVGGHTEFSPAVNRMIVSCVVIGKTNAHVSSRGLQEGDSVIVTKYLGLEGTTILAEKYAEILNLTDAEKEELSTYSDVISIEKEGNAVRNLEVHAMHDVTEGGIYGAIAEIAEGANKGIEILESSVPFTSLTLKICKKLNIDPYRLISSGSLIIVTSTEDDVLKALSDNGVKGTVIGKIVGEKPIAITKNGKIELKVTVDELFRDEGDKL